MRIAGFLWLMLIALLGSGGASADTYPAKPVKILVGFPPGSGSDTTARRLAQKLFENLGQAFVVENRPGGGAALAAELVARAEPDGYTLLASSSGPLILGPLVNKNLRYDTLRDFAPVAPLSRGWYALIVNAKSRFTTLKDFVDAAKANPGKLNYASSGSGVTNHVLMEMFMRSAGVSLHHVPYKGATPALIDLAGGQVDAMFETPAAAEPLVRQGKLRLLAVSSEERLSTLPEVPTVSESGYPGFRGEAWTAILAPARTPAAVLAKLNAEINKILGTSEWQADMRALGSEPLVMTQQEFGSFIKAETVRWGEAVKRSGARIE